MAHDPHIGNQAKLAVQLGLDFALDDDGSIVLHGPTRTVKIRRLIQFQVDEVRFSDPDDAINAAIQLFL